MVSEDIRRAIVAELEDLANAFEGATKSTERTYTGSEIANLIRQRINYREHPTAK